MTLKAKIVLCYSLFWLGLANFAAAVGTCTARGSLVTSSRLVPIRLVQRTTFAAVTPVRIRFALARRAARHGDAATSPRRSVER